MADLSARPYPPGEYPLVVVGSGPGGLQMSYFLSRLGVPHAVLSEDDDAGGMFRRWPLFQRLITWTKPFAPAPRSSRDYERYDWNSLVAEEPEHRGLTATFMDGTSYFPSRPEMERNLLTFAGRTRVAVRYGCRWESTRRDGNRYILMTSEGEYRARVLVIATGMTAPYRPSIPGLGEVPHYAQVKPPEAYRDRSVFIVGKRNSGFELADGILPLARRIVLASPSPARFAIHTRSIAGVRARYIQPFEDHLLRGGVFVLDASIERIARERGGYRVTIRPSAGGDSVDLDADEVIAATGFESRLGDLPTLGLQTFSHYRLPAQTPFWESLTLPGVYFAGTLTQGALGLRKHGIPSASASLHGFRYNARVLARHIAAAHFGIRPPTRTVRAGDLIPYLLAELTRAPELWLQRSYLARVLSVSAQRGIVDEGVLPLHQFVEFEEGDGIAATIELDASGESYPAIYVRHEGDLSEHLLSTTTLLDFETSVHARELGAALDPMGIGPIPVSRAPTAS